CDETAAIGMIPFAASAGAQHCRATHLNTRIQTSPQCEALAPRAAHQTSHAQPFRSAAPIGVEFLKLLQVGFRKVPVNDVPESFDVLRSRIAVVNIVSVLPDVASQDRSLVMSDRIVSIVAALDRE